MKFTCIYYVFIKELLSMISCYVRKTSYRVMCMVWPHFHKNKQFWVCFICSSYGDAFLHSWFFTLALVSFSSGILKLHDALIIISVALVCTIDVHVFPSCSSVYIALCNVKGLPAMSKILLSLFFHAFWGLYCLQPVKKFFSTLGCISSQIMCMLSIRHHGPKVFILT